MTQSSTDGPPVVLPTKSKFAPALFEVLGPSGRSYALRELTAFEQMQADSVSLSTAESLYYRTVLAIESIDGERIVRRESKQATDLLLREISGPDADALVLAYAKAFSPQTQSTNIKNEPTPSD
jgi:hypothetical protein